MCLANNTFLFAAEWGTGAGERKSTRLSSALNPRKTEPRPADCVPVHREGNAVQRQPKEGSPGCPRMRQLSHHRAYAIRAGPLTPRLQIVAQTHRVPGGTSSPLVSWRAPRNATLTKPQPHLAQPCSGALLLWHQKPPTKEWGCLAGLAPSVLASPKPALLAARDVRPQCDPLAVSGHESQVPEAGGGPAPQRGVPSAVLTEAAVPHEAEDP